MVLGTPAYMAPEQAAGQEADVRSDVYSCGIILYQLLTGHRPFEGEANIDVLLMHINTQPKSLREVADGAWIPDAVERVVLRALAKRPAQRYQSAGQLRQALEQAVVVDYGHTGAGETARGPARMSAGYASCLAIIGAAVTTLLGITAVAAGVGREQRRSRRRHRACARRRQREGAAPETGRPSPEPARAKHRSANARSSTSKRGAAHGR